MEQFNKTFLISGGAGFIGSNTAKALLDKGARVVVIDNLSTGRRENLDPRAVFYEMNIADSKLSEVFEKEKPEVIYHFAFNVLVPKSVENPLIDIDSIAGSINLLQNAKNHNVQKFIFASSGFVYGNAQNLPVKEDEPIDPISPYVVSKSAVENYIRFFNKAYKLPYVIFRYAAIYGPGQVTGAMSDYIRKLASGTQASIWGDGTKTRDYVYIDDVVRANLMALTVDPNFENPVFNIGTGKETTLNELYKTIADLLGKKADPEYLEDRPGEQVRYSLSALKAKQILGWEPEHTLEQGLRKRLIAEKYLLS